MAYRKVSPFERLTIENIKRAEKVVILINPDTPSKRITLELDSDKKLYHDIALAYQSAIINNKIK